MQNSLTMQVATVPTPQNVVQPRSQNLAQPQKETPTVRPEQPKTGGIPFVTSLKTSSGVLQTKLTVGPVDDAYEREADAVADQVVRSPLSGTQFQGANSATTKGEPSIQRKCATCEQEEKVQRKALPSIQRKAQSATAQVSPQINQAIHASRGGGQSLDQTTRGYMETNFGRDFGSVKVHTGPQAAALNQSLSAKAFTVGNDIYFNHGQYDPQSQSGRHLLAHELTHTVQQGAGANPLIQRKNVSGGQFGEELNQFSKQESLPDGVLTRLAKSPTFMNMVRFLDTQYIAFDGKLIPDSFRVKWDLQPDGVLGKGPFEGKRVIDIFSTSAESNSAGAGSVGNDWGNDVIRLKKPDSKGDQLIGDWIALIAHETTHTFNRLKGNSKPSASAADRIRAAIQDEIDTRINESKVTDEATKKPALPGFFKNVDSTQTHEVQRDFIQANMRKTYLENFVLGERISKAAYKEGLSADERSRRDAKINALPLAQFGSISMQYPALITYYVKETKMYRVFDSDYEELRFIERIIDSRWREYEKSGGDLDVKERLLQAHALAFFDGIIAYDPRP
jgi:hypothetical protein